MLNRIIRFYVQQVHFLNFMLIGFKNILLLSRTLVLIYPIGFFFQIKFKEVNQNILISFQES